MDNSGRDSPNNYLIGIEMCVNSDGDFNKTRQTTLELTKYLLEKYNLKITDVYRHFDITGKECPKMMIEQSEWDKFKSDVEALMISTEKKGKVKVSELNVREDAGTEFRIIKKLKLGDEINVLGIKGHWYRIDDNQWVRSDYIELIS
jgi:N-acetylmuramoyl-L-alanine amidase CwlA